MSFDHLEVVDAVQEELVDDGVLSLFGHLDILVRMKTGPVYTAVHCLAHGEGHLLLRGLASGSAGEDGQLGLDI